MPFSIRASAALPLLLLLFQSSPASAQAGPSITIVGAPARTTGSGAIVDRPAGVPLNVVNHADCIGDESIQFRLVLDAPLPVGVTLEAWAGEGTIDCGAFANRTPATAQCWPIGTIVPATSTSVLVDVRVEDAIAQFGHAVKTATTHGTASDCGSLPPGPHAITVEFMATSSSFAIGTGATYSLIAATNAGASQSTFSVRAGDGALTLDLAHPDDPAFTGYDVYCAPEPVDASAGEAGAECASSSFAGQSPPSSALLCGQAAPDATTTTITGLTNGVTYAVALSDRDVYGNQGNVSAPQCATPRAAPPGSGSGSGCTMSPAPKTTGLVAAISGLIAVAIVRARRRRNHA